MVKLGRQTESSYSKVYVCVCSSTHRLSQKKRERKMYWGRGQGKQLSSCYSGTPVHLLKTNASVLWASIVFRDCREQCLAAFGISGYPLIQNPGTLISSHCCQCLFTGSQLPSPSSSTWLEGGCGF